MEYIIKIQDGYDKKARLVGIGDDRRLAELTIQKLYKQYQLVFAEVIVYKPFGDKDGIVESVSKLYSECEHKNRQYTLTGELECLDCKKMFKHFPCTGGDVIVEQLMQEVSKDDD